MRASKHLLTGVFVCLLTPPCHPADVVFGRRVYAAQGRTYQQIWELDTHTGRIAQLTNTQRRHAQPVCSPGGKRIWFLSGAFGYEGNTELWWVDPGTRAEKAAAQFKGAIVRLLGGTETEAYFLAYDGTETGLYRWNGNVAKLTGVAPSPDSATLSPDARTLAVEAAGGAVTMMEAGGARGRTLDSCSGPVWSPDSRKLACVSGKRIRVINLTTGVDAARFEFAQRPTAPEVADFAPDGGRLLVKTVGASQSSTSPQFDYWVLDIASGKFTFVGPGQSAVFADAGAVVLATPRELAPVGKAHEWMSKILVIHPATQAQTPAAAGAASNVEPNHCARAGTPAAEPKANPHPANRRKER